MKPKDLLGEEAIHDDYGLVFVDSAPPRSKAMVNITVLQRGKGWDEYQQKYKKYFRGAFAQPDGSKSLRWGFTNRDEYGIKDTVHINSLIIKF